MKLSSRPAPPPPKSGPWPFPTRTPQRIIVRPDGTWTTPEEEARRQNPKGADPDDTYEI